MILEKEIRGRDGPTRRAKICNHKIVNKLNLYCISKNLVTISNICYKMKKYDPLIRSLPSRADFGLESLDLLT